MKNWRNLIRGNLIAGAVLTALFCFAALTAPWLFPYDPALDANLMVAEEPPSWRFPLGTDSQGAICWCASSTGRRYL